MKQQNKAIERYLELKEINASGVEISEKFKQQDIFIDKCQKEDRFLSPLGEGKLVNFPVADGRAWYAIAQVTKTKVKMIHLDICDGYNVHTFEVDSKGYVVAPLSIIQKTVAMNEFYNNLFNKK